MERKGGRGRKGRGRGTCGGYKQAKEGRCASIKSSTTVEI